MARGAPAPPPALAPRPQIPKEPPAGEWGVAMSRKTRVLASMAGPNAAALLKAEVIPDDVEEVTKAKRKEERTRAHKTIKLSEEDLKPYKNKVKNLQRKLKDIEQIEGKADLTADQKTKVANKKQVQKELAEAEAALTRVGGSM